MTTMNISSVISDFKWVLRVLKSSNSKDHLDTSLKCFNLWENKHVSGKFSELDKDEIRFMKYQFWCLFRNKNSRYRVTNR
jgi:hypothetical protein